MRWAVARGGSCTFVRIHCPATLLLFRVYWDSLHCDMVRTSAARVVVTLEGASCFGLVGRRFDPAMLASLSRMLPPPFTTDS
jgi:hypothetical protein